MKFGLSEIGLADDYFGGSAFVGCGRIVEVELRGCVLGIEGFDSAEVAFGFLGLSACLVELGASLVDMRFIEARVNHEKGLAFFDIRTFLEKHAFEVAFDTCVDFDELLCADSAYVFTIYINVSRADGLDFDVRD